MKRSRTDLQGGLDGELLGVCEPTSVVLEGCALPVFAHTSPQAPHQAGSTAKVHVYENVLVHYGLPELAGFADFGQ